MIQQVLFPTPTPIISLTQSIPPTHHKWNDLYRRGHLESRELDLSHAGPESRATSPVYTPYISKIHPDREWKTGRLTRQESNNQSERVSRSEQTLRANHKPTCQKQQGEINHEHIKEQDPGGSNGGNGEDDADDEPHPHEDRNCLVELGGGSAGGRVGVGGHDAGSWEVDHAVGEVESSIGAEDGWAEL